MDEFGDPSLGTFLDVVAMFLAELEFSTRTVSTSHECPMEIDKWAG